MHVRSGLTLTLTQGKLHGNTVPWEKKALALAPALTLTHETLFVRRVYVPPPILLAQQFEVSRPVFLVSTLEIEYRNHLLGSVRFRKATPKRV